MGKDKAPPVSLPLPLKGRFRRGKLFFFDHAFIHTISFGLLVLTNKAIKLQPEAIPLGLFFAFSLCILMYKLVVAHYLREREVAL